VNTVLADASGDIRETIHRNARSTVGVTPEELAAEDAARNPSVVYRVEIGADRVQWPRFADYDKALAAARRHGLGTKHVHPYVALAEGDEEPNDTTSLTLTYAIECARATMARYTTYNINSHGEMVSAATGLWHALSIVADTAQAEAAELDAFRSLQLGALDGRVSATCARAEHPTWLRAVDDQRPCPWCAVEELQAEAVSS
jgi:hypothetical protein